VVEGWTAGLVFCIPLRVFAHIHVQCVDSQQAAGLRILTIALCQQDEGDTVLTRVSDVCLEGEQVIVVLLLLFATSTKKDLPAVWINSTTCALFFTLAKPRTM
jgi:hypothetical protein